MTPTAYALLILLVAAVAVIAWLLVLLAEQKGETARAERRLKFWRLAAHRFAVERNAAWQQLEGGTR